VLLFLVLAAGFLWFRLSGGFQSDSIQVEFTTEAGKGATEGAVNSPLLVVVRMPASSGSGSDFIASVGLALLDEAGNPAVFGDKAVPVLPMRPTLEPQVWEYGGSLPSVAGTYRLRLEWHRPQGERKLDTLDLPDQRLVVTPETGPPLASGYVFNADGDLWIMSPGGDRQRRLTFLASPTDYVEHPAWSPDGKLIAFSYLTGTAATQLPKTSIWTVAADGKGPRPLVEHGDNESLYHPQWSPDGKYLYFTAEDLSTDSNGLLRQPKRIDRLELATGVRSPWLPAAAMPAPTGSGGELVYLEQVPNPEGPVVQQRISIADPDRGSQSVLVGESDFFDLYAPRTSPDRRWVVFAGVGMTTVNGDGHPDGFDPLAWLTFRPRPASAHNFPWELYLVPASGGRPSRLTSLSEDQPHPIWLDAHTLSFIGVKGLHTLSIDGAGQPVGEPRRLADGVQHSTLTWHGP
jgi:hypothetical protein